MNQLHNRNGEHTTNNTNFEHSLESIEPIDADLGVTIKEINLLVSQGAETAAKNLATNNQAAIYNRYAQLYAAAKKDGAVAQKCLDELILLTRAKEYIDGQGQSEQRINGTRHETREELRQQHEETRSLNRDARRRKQRFARKDWQARKAREQNIRDGKEDNAKGVDEIQRAAENPQDVPLDTELDYYSAEELTYVEPQPEYSEPWRNDLVKQAEEYRSAGSDAEASWREKYEVEVRT